MPFRSVLLRIAGAIALIGFSAILSVAFALGFALAAEAGAAGAVALSPIRSYREVEPAGAIGFSGPAAMAVADRPWPAGMRRAGRPRTATPPRAFR
jgi:hypothetical protein